ncbi:putative methyltransferase [Candidatus Termititenax aidoneus]|uniref:Methyltransferase n=1 Tax=Termititenax aidoneus TaxID=2218524 RepID=A0A388TCN9_TERA1|nr:putative methyltransferase [Candidatus Termititenax aidoneus]
MAACGIILSSCKNLIKKCFVYFVKISKSTNNKQQTTNNKQQTTNNKQQTTNNLGQLYNKSDHEEQATISAQKSARLILEIVKKYFMPKSVIDIGCGAGTFLKCWQDMGVKELKGLDLYSGDFERLLVSKDLLDIVDLNNFSAEKYPKYDMAISLEVAEHIQANSSKMFVNNLAKLSDLILFSAAIPFQPGTAHINCRPIQFWVDLFNAAGFDCFDCIRPAAMKNKDIEWWYSQNIMLFAKNQKREMLIAKDLKIDNSPLFFYHSEHVKMLLGKAFD